MFESLMSEPRSAKVFFLSAFHVMRAIFSLGGRSPSTLGCDIAGVHAGQLQHHGLEPDCLRQRGKFEPTHGPFLRTIWVCIRQHLRVASTNIMAIVSSVHGPMQGIDTNSIYLLKTLRV